jgi:hypothetical protein
MSVVRICALEHLRDLLAAAIPELAGKITAGTAQDNVTQVLPCVGITWAGPIKYDWDPGQAEDVAQLPADVDHPVPRGVFYVGDHEGTVQIRVLAGTERKRDNLSQAIVDVFMAQTDEYGYERAGIIAVDVTDCAAVPWLATFELDQDTWVEALGTERQHEGLIECTGSVPALVIRSGFGTGPSATAGIYTMEDLRLGLINDLTASVDADTFGPPAVEVVRINQDGTITPLP